MEKTYTIQNLVLFSGRTKMGRTKTGRTEKGEREAKASQT